MLLCLVLSCLANHPWDTSFMSIEHEFEASMKFESASNYSSALECCQRALLLIEQVLHHSHSDDRGLSIYARTKKNSLLLRIRSLRKRQIECDDKPIRSCTSTFKPAETSTKAVMDNIYDNNLTRTTQSILASRTKLARPKKNVTFSDHVALIVPTIDDVDDTPSEHLIHSFLRKIHRQTASDSDSDTLSSCNDIPIGLTECTLCHKRCSTTNQIGGYCSNCYFYMQRFQPTTS
jgi:hypothetical protein